MPGMSNHYRTSPIRRRSYKLWLTRKALCAHVCNEGLFSFGFKSSVTRMIHQQLNQYQFAWQRNYHEHIIRDDSGLEEIRKYIMNNPVNWKDDDLWVE
jgi:hypothetical protein